MRTVAYLTEIPATVPAGQVVVHNHVRPVHPLGLNGFRAWLAADTDNGIGGTYDIVRCSCDWAPALDEHYRVDPRAAP